MIRQSYTDPSVWIVECDGCGDDLAPHINPIDCQWPTEEEAEQAMYLWGWNECEWCRDIICDICEVCYFCGEDI